MDGKYREFCPERIECSQKCEECAKTKGELGHEINKAYLKSIGEICLCSECADI